MGNIHNLQMEYGTLTVITGPMFSGKSTELIRVAGRLRSIGKKVLGIVHKIDDRYAEGRIVTHNGAQWYENVAVAERLCDIVVDGYDAIIVEELQFFEDAFENIVKWVEKEGVDVICAGLDGDFKRQPFGDILKLIPYADKVIKLNALCKSCRDGTAAHFSRRVIESSEKVLVGGATAYEAVCRKHFLE